ncbi:MAG: hypothetical protein KAT14_02955 [Candidatus Marinimicrobia bacterium]|nr:hypothetical protein [Candidatus Neomarinimicrobiota bacterium]
MKKDEESPANPDCVSWLGLNLTEGNFTINCPGCSEQRTFQVSQFTSPVPLQIKENLKSQGALPTDKSIQWGRTIGGIGLAVIVAILVGIVAAIVLGGVSVITGIIAAVVFMVLRPVFTPMFMVKMPVWKYTCHNCGAVRMIASNGTVATEGSSE